MAIQVSGTEVISNSRVLSNVTGLKTVNGNALLGSGDIAAGASTTYGAVGTYVMANVGTGGSTNPGATVAGSYLKPANAGGPFYPTAIGVGTWRCMGFSYGSWSSGSETTTWVRIS